MAAPSARRVGVLERMGRGLHALGRGFVAMSGGPLYDGAGQGRRTRGFFAPTTGPTSAIAASGETLRNRSRALMRSNPWAFNAGETFVANLVGTGIKPRSLAKDPTLRAAIHQLWADWTDEADATGSTDFYGLQYLIGRGLFDGGEVFVRLRPRRLEDGLSVPLQLQVLEPEHVPLWRNETLPNGNVVKAGIEFDPIGRRVAYYMTREHPGEGFTGRATDVGEVRIPASEVLHIFRPLRAGQVRGEPWLSRVLLRLHDLDAYEDAELVRKKNAAMQVGSVTLPDPEKASEIVGELHDQAASVAEVGMEPGGIMVFGPGEHFEVSQPADVGPNFITFEEQMLRAIAAGTGVTYEMLTGDLSKVSYSSIRAGTLEFRRRCEALIYHVLAFSFRTIWERWFVEAVLAGALPISATRFRAERRELLRAAWVPPGWQWVDPLKEVTAKVMEMDHLMTSPTRVAAERGDDVEQLDEEIRDDLQRRESLGLVRATSAALDQAMALLAAEDPANGTRRTGTNG